MGTRYERSANENEQVVWLAGDDAGLEDAPKESHAEYLNPVSRLFGRSAEAAPA